MISLYIVEDDRDTYNLLKLVIGQTDKIDIVGHANTGVIACKQIEQLMPSVVLMDIGLPDRSGIDCISILKPLCPNTEFIVFTISDQDETIFAALKAGASSYLLKGDEPDTIINSIVDTHNGGSSINNYIARKILNKLSGDDAEVQLHTNSDQFLLTKREEELLHHLSKGLSYKEISDLMHISMSTIKSHVNNTYKKLHVANRTEAMLKYFGRP